MYGNSFYSTPIHFFITAIECPSLSLANGMITYTVDNTPEFDIGTVATHTCVAGFALVGDLTRTCVDDDQADIVGAWSGSAPACERKNFKDCIYIFYIVHVRIEFVHFFCKN